MKQWSQSNHQERLDSNSGLLLCPNYDALFDKGYISFKDDGTILISSSLDDTSKLFLNINDKLKIRMNEIQQQYMKWHRFRLF
ncbi:HNH endonuclease [Peribacillus tepidiphilus]|uniref:HNH endonuclease n=1 Tax=Peribacillus tepidiphilus TaxID=2652445 RepID=UPI0035B54D27